MAKITDREIRERLIISGARALSDAELLAVIIREGTESLSAVGLAEKILADFGARRWESGRERDRGLDREQSGKRREQPSEQHRKHDEGLLSELASASIQRIRQAAGCGTVRAASIAAACELARRITAEKSQTVNMIGSKEDVVRIFAPLAELPYEEFWVLYLTSGGRVIDRAKVSQGGVSGTVVDYKLVVKRAVELLASSLILVHNHPSGIARPSREDIGITETVSSAAALFDINVIDHIVVSAAGAYSFAEHGMMGRGNNK